jgi:secondary thiamine-phosphate synthase enzyme
MSHDREHAGVKLVTTTLTVRTSGPGLTNITPDIARWLELERAGEGQLTLFVRHTSASLVIQENADPDVLKDLEAFMRRLVPWTDSLYSHRTEGPDDMPAHIRAALTNVSLAIPIMGGRMALGTWQAVYLWEHRAEPQQRHVVAQLLGP